LHGKYDNPELPFTSPRAPCRILGINGHLSSPEVHFSDGSHFTGVRAVDFSFHPDAPGTVSQMNPVCSNFWSLWFDANEELHFNSTMIEKWAGK
jgi:hypothetical protein